MAMLNSDFSKEQWETAVVQQGIVIIEWRIAMLNSNFGGEWWGTVVIQWGTSMTNSDFGRQQWQFCKEW